MVGKPTRQRWRDLLAGSVRDQLERESGDIDVYVIAGEAGEGWPAPAARERRTRSDWRGYLGAVLATALAAGISLLIRPGFKEVNLAMLFLLAVIWTAARHGRGPAILASVLGVAAFDFFFVRPYLTLAVSDTEYLLTFGVMLITALVISTLTARQVLDGHLGRDRAHP